MQTAVCFNDLKQAALYFDRVIPVALVSMRGTGGYGLVIEFPEPISQDTLLNLVFDRPLSLNVDRWEAFGHFMEKWQLLQDDIAPYRIAHHSIRDEPSYINLQNAYLQNAHLPDRISLREHFKKYANSLGITDASVLLPSKSADAGELNEDPIIRLSGMKLINTETASWDQIIELRKDKAARGDLQRLRTFFSTNYDGKPRPYIEDDLQNRLDDYERISKKHGFETLTSSIGVLLDSTNLTSAAAAFTAATLYGGPIAGLTSATALEIGKISLEIAKQKRSMKDWKESHDLAYVINARKTLSP
jgi:hypothetical protein